MLAEHHDASMLQCSIDVDSRHADGWALQAEAEVVDVTTDAASNRPRGLRKNLKLRAGMVISFTDAVSYGCVIVPAFPLPEFCH